MDAAEQVWIAVDIARVEKAFIIDSRTGETLAVVDLTNTSE